MEKSSSFERVVGNIPEKIKGKIIGDMEEAFVDQDFDGLKEKEREKTLKELKIISLANDLTNEIRRKYGLDDFDIPGENIHIIKKEAWEKEKHLKNEVAFYSPDNQTIAIKDESPGIVFLHNVFHELLHFKSYNALQFTLGEKSKVMLYRLGFFIKGRKNNEEFFDNINEAITEDLTKKFVLKIYLDPLFSKDLKKTKEVISKYPDMIDSQGEFLIKKEDMFYAAIKKRTLGELIDDFFCKERMTRMSVEEFTYARQRKNLNILIDKLFERNRDYFKNREEIFELFVKGMVTGNILPIGRLIEKTFGNGTFRKIGELDSKIEDQRRFIESL